MNEVLRNRPELTKEAVMGLIEEKKNTVGAGYLTSQGALFLIAGELHVPLEQVSSDLTLSDLYVGASDITVVGRVLAVYPASVFKKKDGGEGRYRRVVLFDSSGPVRLTLWDERVEDAKDWEAMIGTPVRVVSGYVRQGLDGRPDLSLGKRGRLERVTDEGTANKIPSLERLTERLTSVSEPRQFVALECVVSSDPRYSEFVRADGTPGSLYQFGVVPVEGKRLEYRIVIWNPTVRPELKPGQAVRVTNVRSRQSARGDFEIHGDSGSSIAILTRVKTSELRVASVTREQGKMRVLGINKRKGVEVVESPNIDSVRAGDVATVVPDSERFGRLICESADSFRVTLTLPFPSLSDLATKVKEARDESLPIMVEVIALSNGTVEDVHMNDGTIVKKGELVVGDNTGEIKLVCWREYSNRVVGIEPGERLRVVGVTPKMTKMGAWTLQVSNITAIEKVRSA